MNPRIKHTGGPAFPHPRLASEHFQPQVDLTGMSLRDYFAAKALEAQIVKLYGHSLFDEGGCTYAKLAQESYLVADAMLKAREA
jgi:hypothetical protein